MSDSRHAAPVDAPPATREGARGHHHPTDDPLLDVFTLPGHLLRRCHQIAVAVFLDECRDHDLTPPQFATLAALAAMAHSTRPRSAGERRSTARPRPSCSATWPAVGS